MSTQIAPTLIEAMVIGAHIGGGMTTDRAEIIRTVARDHQSFAEAGPFDIEALLSAAQQRLADSTPAERLAQLSGSHSQTAYQLLVIVALVEEEGEEQTEALLSAGEALGLTHHKAWAVLEAGIPPALMDVRVPAAPEETYLDVLLAAAAADGRLVDEEMVALIDFASSCQELSHLPRTEIEDLMHASLQGFLDYGFSFWLENLADDLPEAAQRQTALRLATAMVEADAQVTTDEQEFLAALKLALHL